MGSIELLFATRIVSVDYYMAEPVAGLDLERSEFSKSDIRSVPVIRVFGSTPSGQTTCLHVHGVFSYLMIPYDGPDVVETHWSEVESYMHVLAVRLDDALNGSGRKLRANQQHVFKIILLRGIPFYGYHAEEELFLKVYFYFPGDVKKAADILQNGMVLDHSFQVHEAHIPYVLQYFLDYNLYGMNLLHARNCWFRLPIGKPDPISELPMIRRPEDVPSEGVQNTETNHIVTGKNQINTDDNFQVPTMSQCNFDWNSLRAKALSRDTPNAEEFEQAEDLGNLSAGKSVRLTTSQSAQKVRRTSHCLSCSDLCKSVISKTLTQDSTLVKSPEFTAHHSCPLHTVWTSETVPAAAKLPIEVGRHSTCDIEVDVLAADIANRYELTSQSTSNPGIEAIWEDERSRRRDRDEDSQFSLDHSQPRVLPDNLTERESRFFQMLFDSLGRYKEENSIRTLSESSSFNASSSSMRMSSSYQSHSQSNDLFASGNTITNNDDIISSGGSKNLISSPVIISSGSSKGRDSELIDLTGLDQGVSTLEMLRRLDERESSASCISTQRGNGPLDDDQEQLDSEGCLRLQNRKTRNLSQSFHNSPGSQLIDSFSNSTQPLPIPSDDEVEIENFEMSQRWDSAIQDLLNDLSDAEDQNFRGDGNDDIPQLDGNSDDQPKNTTVKPGPGPAGAKRQYAVRSKHNNSDFMKNLINLTSGNVIGNDPSLDNSSTKAEVTKATTEVGCRENVDVKSCETNQCTVDTVSALPNDAEKSKNDTHFSMKHNLPLRNTSNTIFDKDEEIDTGSSGDGTITESNKSIRETRDGESGATASGTTPIASRLGTASPPSSVTLTKRQPNDRTNVFSRILNESEGVTLYDNTNLCKFTHTAIINLDQMSESRDTDKFPISTLDGSLIKITSIPINEKKSESDKCCSDRPATRKSRSQKKTDSATLTEVTKPTRTRRPRLASKNSYLDDTLFETVFTSDFESDVDDVRAASSKASTPAPKSTNTRKSKAKKKTEGRKKKERVITKWIIVNRFKGVSSMRVGLWRIPNLKRVKLTAELLRMYELYSPRKVDIAVKPVRPPFIHPPSKPRPMGRRSKHMLASLCLFGPLSIGSGASSTSVAQTYIKTLTKNQNVPAISCEGSGVMERSNDHNEMTTRREKSENVSDLASGGKQRNTGKDSNYRAASGSLKLSTETARTRMVKGDSPILEKMAFDLMRHEDSLGEQYPNICDVRSQQDGKDTNKFKEVSCVDTSAKSTSAPLRESKSDTSAMSPAEWDSASLLPLKITCCTADVAAMKQDTASETEVNSLNQTGCTVHSNDPCKEGCTSNKPSKATIAEKEALFESVVRQAEKIGLEQAMDVSSGVVEESTAKKSQGVLKTVSCVLSNDGIADSSVALKGLCINLGHPVSNITPEVVGKDKFRAKIGEAEQIAKLKRNDNEKSIKKKSVRSKKEAKKRKIDKAERDAKSPHGGDRETKVSRSIVPVTSRTVEPICKRDSPILELESDCDITQSGHHDTSVSDISNFENDSDVKENPKPDDSHVGDASHVKKTTGKMKHVISGKGQRSMMKVAVAANIESTVITKAGIAIQEKKTVTTVTSTRKIYSPSKKVTRNSVAVKLNSINPPTTMFTSVSDDSSDAFPPLNALMTIAFPPTPPKRTNVMNEPPRPWTPVKTKKTEPTPQDNADNILEELAESFGADGTKVLDIVDESLFNNINCFEDLITGHKSQSQSENQKEAAMEKTGCRAKDKNERMLEHFDKIFEDVTSCGSSKVSVSAAHSSRQFDEFEEETLMEFIDEMTSPTQLGNSNSSQMMSFPVAAPTPMERSDVSIGNKDPTMSKQPLQQIQYPVHQQATNELRRPHSTLPHAGHAANVSVRKQFVNEKWSTATLQDRPQSCLPASSLPDVAQIPRSQSVMGHWNKDVRQEQNAVFDNSQMMKIHSNVTTSPMTYKPQDLCYGAQNESGYFVDPRSTTQHAMNRPYPYSFNQHYHDPTAIPRPNSVMDTPLQVFHTHVHHHHHVHSINNSNPAATGATHENFRDHKIGHQIFQTARTDKTNAVGNVKVEKIVNPTWPQSAIAMPGVKEKLHKPQGALDTAQFHETDPSLLFSKSGQQVHLQSPGLVQTLTYVNRNVPQNTAGKSNFYNFAGLDPKTEGIVQSSIILQPQSQSYRDVPSVLLKGTCQLPQWERTSLKKSTKRKTSQKGKVVKRRKSNLVLCQSMLESTNFDSITTSAKTPYGIMKQNSLNNLKKQKDDAPKSIERKRKTISNFRAPPDTPTISLSGWTSVDTKNDSAAFELSQDLFETPIHSKTVSDLSHNDKSIPSVPLPQPNERCDEKLVLPDTLSKENDAISETVSESSIRPTPQVGEELILNSATGEWEVVPAELHKSDDENKLCVKSPGELPTLTDSSIGFRKRNLSKLPDLSSDDDVSDIKRKKNVKIGSAKVPFSAPEYMVSSVDLKSDSPRLKLTLKKTLSSRGKPKFSTLPSCDSPSDENLREAAIVQSEVTNSSCDLKSDQSDAVNDFIPLKIVRMKSSTNNESESDYRIDDSDSTDDASEVGSVAEDDLTPLDEHKKSVVNMYVTQVRRSRIPFCVIMDEFYVTNALTAMKNQASVIKERRAWLKGSKKSSAESKYCKTSTSYTMGKDTSVHQDNVKQLLDECCDQVASSVIFTPKFQPTGVPFEATSGKESSRGQNFGEEKPQKDNKNGTGNAKSSSDAINPTASKKIKEDLDPPSPAENKKFLQNFIRPCFDDVRHFYVTSNKPPAPSQVMHDLQQTGQAIGLYSEEPFYGDKNDVQSTSNRLSNLPPYIKKPKPQKTITELYEIPLSGGIHEQIVMATAQKCYTDEENSVLREKASKILPENVHVWDHLDVACKLSQYPALAKVLTAMSKDIILRTANQPPTKGDVRKWMEEEKNRKRLKKSSKVESKTATSEIGSSLLKTLPVPRLDDNSLISPKTSSFSSPRPRRVSFDVATTSNQDEFKIIKRKRCLQRSIKGSVNKSSKSTIWKSTQTSISPMHGLISPFAPWLSPVTPTTTDDNLLDIFSHNQSSVTSDIASSAIKSLVGSSNQDDTSISSLISGTFTPVMKFARNDSSPQQCDGSMEKQPQSTPNYSKQYHSRAHKKLSYTPTMQLTADSDNAKSISPISTKSTPILKSGALQRAVLKKNVFQQSSDDVVTETGSPNDSAKTVPSHRSSQTESPSLSLNTPRIGKKEGSQIDGPTLDNTHGFKAPQQNLGDAKSLHVVQHITVLSLELHIKTRIDLRPDPDMDEIRCLFYCLESDSWTGSERGMRTGVIVVDAASVSQNEMISPDDPNTSTASRNIRKDRELLKKSGVTSLEVLYVKSEMDLFLRFAQIMHRWDPDILVGYEVQMLSWGFLLQRAAHLRCDLCRAISRVPADEQRNKYQAVNDAYGADNASELHIVGRVVLNLWRLMRTELALYDYGFESIAFHMLHERYPAYDHKTLTNWFDPPVISGVSNHCHRWRVMDYFVSRVQGNMRLLMQQDFIGRTSELARLFGIQFYEVLTRGSQFRVESMLLRTARAHNFVAVTPSILQRAQMRAPEVIALVMEPESKFYHVPVVVVDFQSLYPSMVIAYNICYSTCLGRVEFLGSDAVFTFGCTSLRVPAKTLNKLIRKNLIMINPSGVAFVKAGVRRGVMPQMLDEILTTRIMVKNSMKKLRPEDSATKRMLDHRQLGLKLIANVTYGYTAANYSGRMPCVEIGDSIVHKARETLERAIQLVMRQSSRWENARVVYGDTDSMFIALEGVNNAGCSKARAFEVGREICAAVTADNPTPVKLRFEKVYLPCVLQTKKRYVGYAFESEDQKEPIFDAKGIETVRRDGTPATAKILEKTLKILFDTRDVSQVKQYVLKQCGKLLDGRTTLQDCIIAKEYRGKQYYKPGAIVPALQIARKLLAMDRRAEPRVGERVPYVVVHGAPGTPLYQLVKSPLDVLRDPTLQLNGAYYVTKQVLPALDRMLSLLGVDVFLWHKFIPRMIHSYHNADLENSQDTTTKKATISQFFKSKHCLVCKSLSIRSICENCLAGDEAKQKSAVSLTMEAKSLERRKHHINKICMQCTGAYCSSEIRCVSLDCSTLYKSFRAAYDSSKVKSLRKALQKDDLF